MQKETWVVTANSSVARFFKLNGLSLMESNTLVHPEGRMLQRDYIEDRAGSTNPRFGTGSTTAYSQESSPKKNEAVIFAKQISDLIDHERRAGKLGKVFLAASPAFLGILRSEMNDQTLSIIEADLDKDITHLNPKEILTYFPIGL